MYFVPLEKTATPHRTPKSRNTIFALSILISTLVTIGLLGISGCSRSTSPKHTIAPAFYYWKQNFVLTENDQQYLSDIGVQTLYIKLFDVVLENNQPLPTAVLTFEPPIPKYLKWVPVIFITNKTFEKISLAETEKLAENVAQKIKAIAAASGHDDTVLNEIQIDCDWTQQTRTNYFHFLTQIRQYFPSPLVLSATIRLHQVKYKQKTGLPPIDKGLLMYYNMGKLDSWHTQNSILDNIQGLQYLNNKSQYPLPLDIGLPIFSWGLLFREKKFSGIFNGLHPTKADTLGYLQKISDGRYKVKNDTFYNQTRLKKGDKIRIEHVTRPDLLQAADVCRPLLKSSPDTLHVLIFHYDTLFTQHFIEKDWERIFEGFR